MIASCRGSSENKVSNEDRVFGGGGGLVSWCVCGGHVNELAWCWFISVFGMCLSVAALVDVFEEVLVSVYLSL